MAKKRQRTPAEQTSDPSIISVLQRSCDMDCGTAFSRADDMQPCPIGRDSKCCKNCAMGPCRLLKPGQVGVCGATIDTIAARNFARSVAVGSAAHIDHGRGLAYTLLEVAEGRAKDYQVTDPRKLTEIAGHLDVPTDGKSLNELAHDVAKAALNEFGKTEGEILYARRAPEKRQQIWHDLKLVPRSLDREVIEMLHRTHIGNDQDAEHLLDQAMRTALADGWGGSMLGTDISDALFGTPGPVTGSVGLGVLSETEVNIVVHGHEPTLSEMIVVATQDPELIDYAKTKGAEGITLSGLCCTANEILMRQGIPTAGSFLQQELALLTGSVEAIVVDVQCIFQGLVAVADRFHTEVITTSPKAKITGATHIEFDEARAMDIAKEIVRRAIDRFPERGETAIPQDSHVTVPGFSHEYINYALGGVHRGSFRPLNDAIMAGRIRGVVANIGCTNPRVKFESFHRYLVEQFIKNDVLVVDTGCASTAIQKLGFMTPEAALKVAGPGLREVCETVGIPPVLHMGSCVDNSRILTVLSQIVNEGGLGEDISDIPAVGMAPEWMSEKALAIATYCVASGAYVIMGIHNPVEGSEFVTEFIKSGWENKVGGKLEFIMDPDVILQRTLEHIDQKRAALNLPPYNASLWGRSGDARMLEFLKLPVEKRIQAVYGSNGNGHQAMSQTEAEQLQVENV
ncbi:MAG: anaerobic carbon-monoxide dehydrogenase catalytic subunit [Anaerolineae bacterium]|nr:anaerobic carbon-monoxide dehydrogenase catalytic subunit [Anaerolineae bacterium]